MRARHSCPRSDMADPVGELAGGDIIRSLIGEPASTVGISLSLSLWKVGIGETVEANEAHLACERENGVKAKRV